MKALLISDVYFPRVNGVSTSIRSFRDDLAAAGVQTTLVVPQYPTQAAAAEPGIVRVPSAGVPRDPEDRRMRRGARARSSGWTVSTSTSCVQTRSSPTTPACASRAATASVVATYHCSNTCHYVPPRAARQAISARGYALAVALDAIVSPSEPMRAARRGVRAPVRVIPTGRRPTASRGRWRALCPADPRRPAAAAVRRRRHERTSTSSCTRTRAARRAPTRCW
jgi:hypothetical protein